MGDMVEDEIICSLLVFNLTVKFLEEKHPPMSLSFTYFFVIKYRIATRLV